MSKRIIALVSLLSFCLSFSGFFVSVTVADSGSSPAVFMSNSFDEALGMSVVKHGGTIEHIYVSGNGAAHFSTLPGANSSSYADIDIPIISDAKDYILEADVTVNKMDSNAFLNIFDCKDSEARWRLGLRFESGGIYAKKNNSGFVKIGSFTFGKTVHAAIVNHPKEGLYDAYINGKLACKNVECTKTDGSIFRIDMISQNSGKIDFYVDNFRAYSGTEFMSDSYFDNLSPSVVNQEQAITNILGNCGAYGVDAPYYFQNKSKHAYLSDGERCIESDGEAYVPAGFLTSVLQVDDASSLILSSADSICANGRTYIPARTAAEHIGKEYLYDKRGFFILSDSAFEYADSDNFIKMFEISDYIYRYLCFANPSGTSFAEDFAKVTTKGAHPRLIYNDADIAYIKDKVKKDNHWAGRVNNIINAADNILASYDGKFTANCSSSAKDAQSKAFQTAIENLSVAYFVTDNTAYADKAIEFMKILASWETLDWQTSNLITGHWAMGMAIGYDAFYDYMMSSEQGKSDIEFIKSAVLRLPFADAISAYKGNNGPRWISVCDNFMGVIGGGMISLVLAFADEDDMQNEIRFLAENIIKSLEIATSLYFPNGGYFEGVTYSAYMLENLSIGIEALWKCCGTDYNLGGAKGFSKAGEFFAYMQTAKGQFNFHDSGAGFTRSKIPYWLAYRYGETETAKLWYKQNEVYSTIFDLASLFFADKAINCEGDASAAALDRYFYTTDAGSFRSGFDSPNEAFVGFHAGRTGLTHDMLDLGQFVFEADGVCWAIDLGSDSYSLPGYFKTDGYKIYRKNPEGENCVVISPKNNMNADGSMNWYGQKLNAYAPLIFMKSAPRAAMAAYDLTDAYCRDVNSYTRGYYFGDNRKTLLVQDEIDLKDVSEVYWFMHTKADIEIIDSTTALLSSGQKTLIAKLVCSEPGCEFKKMAAQPLPTSPFVEGQSSNTGVSKLTVHIPEASGDVRIKVKLIPQASYSDSEPINDLDIAGWTLPEGEIIEKSVLNNISVDSFNKLSANVKLLDTAMTAKLFIDSKFVCDVDTGGKLQLDISDIDVSYLDSGTHIAQLDITYSEGETESVCASFECDICKEKIFYENDLKNYNGASVSTPAKWTLGKEGTAAQSDNGFSLVSTASSKTVWLDYRGSSSYSFSGDRMVVAFDVSFSKTTGNFVIECQNSAGSWFMAGLRIFNSGRLLNGAQYEANKTYHVEMVLDSEKKKGYIYVDGALISQTSSVPSDLNLTLLKLLYNAAEENARVTYSDFKVYELMNDAMPADIELFAYYNGLKAKVKCSIEASGCKLFVAHYADSGMISAACFAAADGGAYSTDVPEGTLYSKAFLMSADNNVKPLALPYYYRIR